MSLDINGLIAEITSHAETLGVFDRVNQHEPKNAPGNGMTYAVWCQGLRPVPQGSGLAASSGLLTMFGRLYLPAFQAPYDDIDPAMTDATSQLLEAYSGDFTLDDAVRNIDLLGSTGTPLSALAGYLDIDKKMYRVMTITIPIVINDLWEQIA